MIYFKNSDGIIFEFEDSVLVLQPGKQRPLKLPNGKTSVYMSKVKLTPIETPIFENASVNTESTKQKETASIIRETLLEKLEQKRKQAETAEIEVNGMLWSTSLKSEVRLTNALRLLESTLEIPDWKTSNGSVTLTKELAEKVLKAIAEYHSKVFSTEAKKAKEISSIKTVKSLKAYESSKLDSGWN